MAYRFGMSWISSTNRCVCLIFAFSNGTFIMADNEHLKIADKFSASIVSKLFVSAETVPTVWTLSG